MNSAKNSLNVGILNFHYENFNFGANLVAFSLIKFLQKLGHNPTIINFNPLKKQSESQKFTSEKFYNFRERFLPMTKEFKSANRLTATNDFFDGFIVGSDQVWNPMWTRKNRFVYFLDFAADNKLKISYAASFGTKKMQFSPRESKKIAKLLNRFDAISIREKSALQVLNSWLLSDIPCVWCLDPTLLLDKADYQQIIDEDSLLELPQKYIAHYFVSDYCNLNKLEDNPKLEAISQSLRLPLVSARGKDEVFDGKACFKCSSIGNWLNIIKNSEIFVTDSFHGVCFAVIFKKKFFYVDKLGDLNERILSLFEILGLRGKIYENFEQIESDIQNRDLEIDYVQVYENLDAQREKSMEFLSSALEKPHGGQEKLQVDFAGGNQNFWHYFCSKVKGIFNGGGQR